MVKIIEGKKTDPMMGCFILLTSSSILLQITCIRACSKAKMMTVFNIYIIYTFLHSLLDLLQLNLSETAKHWDSFLTHCRCHSADLHIDPSTPNMARCHSADLIK